jgi:hypothetical protein
LAGRRYYRSIWLAQCLLALCLATTSGCGKRAAPLDTSRPVAAFNEGADPVFTKPGEPPKPPVRMAVRAPPAKAPAGDGARAAQPPPKPARPPNVADWRRDDYYSARQDGDPKLAAAVGYLGQHFAGKTSAAELLLRLLDPAATPRERASREADARVIEDIVTALAVNGTPLAWQSIDQLACGNLKTSDNPAAATAALKTLLGRPGQDNEESLLRVVALQGEPQPADRPAAERKAQHRILLDLLRSSASASLRLRLANYMIAPETPPSWHEELWTCLQDPRPENLAAQSVLYRSNRPDPAARRLLEQRLIAGSSAAVGRLLSTVPPPGGQPAAGASSAADPYAVAEQLWNPGFASAIERRLAAIDSLEQGASLLLLASVIPGERVRAAILRAFRLHWEEDPKPLEAARAAAQTIPEPGFLLAAKVMARKDAAAHGAGNSGVPHAPGGKGPKPPRTAKAAALREAKQQREHITQHWVKFAENLLRAMGQQFRAAAGATPGGSTAAGAGSDAKDLPLKLHSPADVVAAYRADWPQGLVGKPAGLVLSPLRVRYVRIEQQARPQKVLAYYRRQLPDCEEHHIEQGVWLDGLTTTGESGAARSIDVLVAEANKDLPPLADQEQRLIVEVLAVECVGIGAKSAVAIGK